MHVDYRQHYSAEYWTHRKTYHDAHGQEQLYQGPGDIWEGFNLVADTLLRVIPSARTGAMLDIGCSFGDWMRRMHLRGWDPYGIDISEYAVARAPAHMRPRMAVGDITEPGGRAALPASWPGGFELVTALDLLEHLYEEDLDATFRWLLSKASRHLFFCVAVMQPHEQGEFVLRKGHEVPREWEAVAVAGHVNVRPVAYWRAFFERHGLRICWDAMYEFQRHREVDAPWKGTPGWNMGSTWILEVP